MRRQQVFKGCERTGGFRHWREDDRRSQEAGTLALVRPRHCIYAVAQYASERFELRARVGEWHNYPVLRLQPWRTGVVRAATTTVASPHLHARVRVRRAGKGGEAPPPRGEAGTSAREWQTTCRVEARQQARCRGQRAEVDVHAFRAFSGQRSTLSFASPRDQVRPATLC
jgi:hypothetical protein